MWTNSMQTTISFGKNTDLDIRTWSFLLLLIGNTNNHNSITMLCIVLLLLFSLFQPAFALFTSTDNFNPTQPQGTIQPPSLSPPAEVTVTNSNQLHQLQHQLQHYTMIIDLTLDEGTPNANTNANCNSTNEIIDLTLESPSNAEPVVIDVDAPSPACEFVPCIDITGETTSPITSFLESCLVSKLPKQAPKAVCAICLQRLGILDLASYDCCAHYFHSKCLHELSHHPSPASFHCPLCRQEAFKVIEHHTPTCRTAWEAHLLSPAWEEERAHLLAPPPVPRLVVHQEEVSRGSIDFHTFYF